MRLCKFHRMCFLFPRMCDRNGGRRLRQWLIEQIDSTMYPGLIWENDEKTMFRIPWKHAGKQDYNQEVDASIFKVETRSPGALQSCRAIDVSSSLENESSFFFFLKIFIWLHQVLVVAGKAFDRGTPTLVMACRLFCPCSRLGLSSPTRDRTHVPLIARQILNHWTTKEVPLQFLKTNTD